MKPICHGYILSSALSAVIFRSTRFASSWNFEAVAMKPGQLVIRLTARKLDDIQRRLTDLAQLQRELSQSHELCQGSDQGCPILADLDRPD